MNRIHRLFIFLSIFFFSASAFSQGRKMELLFDANGKLLSGYTPRFNPDKCKDGCDESGNLVVKILVPLNFYEKEWNEFAKRSKAIFKISRDSDSGLLAKILRGCGDNVPGYVSQLGSTANEKSFDEWGTLNSELFPENLKDYVRFLRAFNEGIKDSVANETSLSLKPDDVQCPLRFLEKRKIYSPFRLRVNNFEIDTSCMSWKIPDEIPDDCNCIQDLSRFVTLEFRIPSALLTAKTSPDSFQLERRYYDKEMAIKWYRENMVKGFKNDLTSIRIMDGRIREHTDSLAMVSAVIDSLLSLMNNCKNEPFFKNKRSKLEASFADFQTYFSEKLGNIRCSSMNNAFICCSEPLRLWIARLLWLNGEELRLNPFNFTSDDAFTGRKSRIQKEIDSLLVLRTKAKTQSKFWDTAIMHLQDSIMRRDLDINLAKTRLDTLLRLRAQADSLLAIELPELPNTDIVKNLNTRTAFLTTRQVLYKGWIVPYWEKTSSNAYKRDKQWVRSYYLDQVPEPLQQKLHFTYPENENVTLLLHNIPGGTGSALKQTLKSFSDSAAFTRAAGEFVGEISSLYSSLTGITPKIAGLLKFLNARPAKSGTGQDGTEIPESSFAGNVQLAGIAAAPQIQLSGNDWQQMNNRLNQRWTNNDRFLVQMLKADTFLYSALASRRDTGDLRLGFERISGRFRDTVKLSIARVQNSISYTSALTREQIDPNILSIICSNQSVNYILVRKEGRSMDMYYPVRSRTIAGMAQLADAIRKSEFPEQVPEGIKEADLKCYRDYYQGLLAIASASPLLSGAIEPRADTTPVYKSDRYPLNDSAAPYTNEYVLSTYTKQGDKTVPGITVASSHINIGKFRYFQTAAGFAYTPDAGFINSVDTTNGGLVISRDEDRFRLIGGFRIYPFGLYNQRNPAGLFKDFFREGRWLHRLSILGAVGVPKPFQNLYLGGGFDVVPGLNLTIGAHFQQQNRYEIINNQVKDRTVSYKSLKFYSVTIDPVLLVNAVKSLF